MNQQSQYVFIQPVTRLTCGGYTASDFGKSIYCSPPMRQLVGIQDLVGAGLLADKIRRRIKCARVLSRKPRVNQVNGRKVGRQLHRTPGIFAAIRAHLC